MINMVKEKYLNSRTLKELAKKGIMFGMIILLYAFVGCPIRWAFGIPCAGCGMTRAVTALLHGDIAAALHFHPLVFLLPIGVCVYFFRTRIPKNVITVLTTVVLAAFIIVYLVRLFIGSDVVSIDLGSGAVVSFFIKYFRRF